MRYRDPNYPKRIGNVIHESRIVTIVGVADWHILYTREGIFIPKTPNLAKFRLPLAEFNARYSELVA
jgi:hypothetical protein